MSAGKPALGGLLLSISKKRRLLGAIAMELNRNQFFMIGLVVLLLGIQLRVVDSYTLNQRLADEIAKRRSPTPVSASFASSNDPFVTPVVQPAFSRNLDPPGWLGWALISVGGVLICHSLAMRKPGD